jgi:type III secretion system (T3SS) inner membrane Yop/YscD-like protein
VERVIWVEVLGRRGEIAQRVRVERLPLTIGRAYTNDIVLDDPGVDPVHARLVPVEDGPPVLEDAGSVNGVVVGKERRREPRVAIDAVTVVWLGHTQIRLVPADAPVAAAVPMAPPARGLEALVSGPASSLVILAGVAIGVVSLWFDTVEKSALTKALGGTAGIFLATALWAGLWALVGRSTVHRAAFLSHLAATWVVLVAIDLTSALLGGGASILGLDAAGEVVEGLVALALLTWLLATHLGLATAMGRARRYLAGAAVVIGLAGVTLLVAKAADSDFDSGNVTLEVTLPPVPARMLRTSEASAFVERSASLAKELDRIADRK